MCYDADARPPLPPIRGSALDAGELTLTASDGIQVAAYAARAGTPSGAGIVILPDVRGLHPFFEELALRFAEAGVDAIAIDYFSRTAGTGRREPGFVWKVDGEQEVVGLFSIQISCKANSAAVQTDARQEQGQGATEHEQPA